MWGTYPAVDPGRQTERHREGGDRDIELLESSSLNSVCEQRRLPGRGVSKPVLLARREEQKLEKSSEEMSNLDYHNGTGQCAERRPTALLLSIRRLPGPGYGENLQHCEKQGNFRFSPGTPDERIAGSVASAVNVVPHREAGTIWRAPPGARRAYHHPPPDCSLPLPFTISHMTLPANFRRVGRPGDLLSRSFPFEPSVIRPERPLSLRSDMENRGTEGV